MSCVKAVNISSALCIPLHETGLHLVSASSCTSFPPQDQACEEVDYQVESTSSSEGEEDEQETQRKQQAVYEKEKVGLVCVIYVCYGQHYSTRVGTYYLRHLLSVRVEKGVWHAVQDVCNSLVLWVNYRHRFIFAVHHLWVR